MKIQKLALRGVSALALGASAVMLGTMAIAPSAIAQEKPPLIPETADHRIPVAEFVKQANMRAVRISPDGSKLVYRAAKDGRQVLVLLDLNDLTKPAKPILAATEARESGDRTLSSYRWVGNDHVVMTIISREDLGAGLGDFRRLVAYNINNGEMIKQAWRDSGADAASILHIDHEAENYLVQRDSTANTRRERWGIPEVVEVNVKDGRFKMVQRTNPIVRGWIADGTGKIRAGFNSNRDNGKIRMLYRSEDGQVFKTVYNEADATFTENLPSPELFIPGTDIAYVTSRHEGYTKVYKMDMNTMKMVETVYETDGFDVRSVYSNDDRSDIVGFATFDGTNRPVFTDPDLKTVHDLLSEMFNNDEISITDYSDDRSIFIFSASGKNRAGGSYLFNTKTGSVRLLNWTRDALKDAPINPVKAEWYTASDGTKIQAIVTYPRHRMGEKNLPVVVMPHGGPFGAVSATNSTEPWNQPLAEAGYVVIQPNYRGSGNYGKAFEQLGREPGGYGKRMQDDLNDILTFYGERGVVDPNRACIMGWSYGGYAAARGAQRDPEVWKCALAGAGVYDMPLMNKWDARNLGRFSAGFQATSDDAEGISPAAHTDGNWSPILIVTAKRDARIPMEQAETLVRNLRNSGKQEGTDFKYIVQKQGTHHLPYDDVHIEWIEAVEAWLDKYNPAYVEGDASKAPPTMKFD